ncbi:hypothetical protein LIER_40474 [Lithospermum erythrorhizon]|uniref:Transmembrane protein n=1 Tax=Lithospermum erythrorhizon TaxID=34254 RepID=A0AAV3QYV0_LITER
MFEDHRRFSLEGRGRGWSKGVVYSGMIVVFLAGRIELLRGGYHGIGWFWWVLHERRVLRYVGFLRRLGVFHLLSSGGRIAVGHKAVGEEGWT